MSILATDLPPELYYDAQKALFVSIDIWATTRVTALLQGDQLRMGNPLLHMPVIGHASCRDIMPN